MPESTGDIYSVRIGGDGEDQVSLVMELGDVDVEKLPEMVGEIQCLGFWWVTLAVGRKTGYLPMACTGQQAKG